MLDHDKYLSYLQVINLYLELLKEREEKEPKRFLKCHFFNTFFYKKVRLYAPIITSAGCLHLFSALKLACFFLHIFSLKKFLFCFFMN